MLYVTKFEADATKSYTSSALHWIKALQTQNVAFELRPLDNMLDWSRMQSWAQPLKDYFRDSRSNNECALVHALPTDLVATRLYKSKNKSIGVTTLETSRLPLWVGDALNASYKGLIVPSEFNKESLRRSGVSIPIEVVPHAIGDWWLTPKAVTPKEKDPSVYTFGYVGHWNSRKNPQMILDAYLEAFPEPRTDVALMLKTYGAPPEVQHISREDIWVYSEEWSEGQMQWGFGMLDCYISAHKGEGFGLALAQAAAMGKPVVYSDYSAPTEWLGAGHYPIRTDVVEVTATESVLSGSISGKGLQWGAPDKDHLITLLRELAVTRPASGFDLEDLARFRAGLSWESVGHSLVAAIERITEAPLARKSGTQT